MNARRTVALAMAVFAWGTTAAHAEVPDAGAEPNRRTERLHSVDAADEFRASPRIDRVPTSCAAPWEAGDLCRGPARRRDWSFYVAPYGWLAGNTGTVVTDGEVTDLDLPFEDLADRVSAGFQLYAEVRWRRFFAAFDGTWATLGDAHDGRLLGVKVEVDQRLFDMRLGYQLLRRSLDGPLRPECEPWRRWLQVDVYIGARYFDTDVTVTVTGPLGFARPSTSRSERVDPFLGARVTWDVGRRWSAGLRADIGGFGIGDAAQLAWQLQATLGYRLTSHVSVLLGYRLLSTDTVTGSGAQRNGSDLLQHGPTIGVAFRF